LNKENKTDDNELLLSAAMGQSSASIGFTKAGAGIMTVSGAGTYTVGLKWILNPNLMVKAAYSRTKYDDAFYYYDIGSSSSSPIGGLMKTEDILSVRGQYTF
jgi:hypothetical protein